MKSQKKQKTLTNKGRVASEDVEFVGISELGVGGHQENATQEDGKVQYYSSNNEEKKSIFANNAAAPAANGLALDF